MDYMFLITLGLVALTGNGHTRTVATLESSMGALLVRIWPFIASHYFSPRREIVHCRLSDARLDSVGGLAELVMDIWGLSRKSEARWKV